MFKTICDFGDALTYIMLIFVQMALLVMGIGVFVSALFQ